MSPSRDDFLNDRRRALEDSFFAERDRELLAKLRGELYKFEDRQQLSHVSGILDEKVLSDLLAAGIRGETLAAMRVIPLVEVAWSDGRVSPEERHAVLRAAANMGILPDTVCYSLLSSWLENRPDPRIIAGWKDYVSELAKSMPKESLKKMREELVGRLQTVAEAAGGFLGVGKVSRKEQDAIDLFVKSSMGE